METDRHFYFDQKDSITGKWLDVQARVGNSCDRGPRGGRAEGQEWRLGVGLQVWEGGLCTSSRPELQLIREIGRRSSAEVRRKEDDFKADETEGTQLSKTERVG